MNDFWKAVGAGALVFGGAYALSEAFPNSQVGVQFYAGPHYGRGNWDRYNDGGWNCRPPIPYNSNYCDWGFNGRQALDSWNYRRGFDAGYNTGANDMYRYDRMLPYQGGYEGNFTNARGQYVPWWT